DLELELLGGELDGAAEVALGLDPEALDQIGDPRQAGFDSRIRFPRRGGTGRHTAPRGDHRRSPTIAAGSMAAAPPDDPRRALPAVDRLLAQPEFTALERVYGRERVRVQLRHRLDRERQERSRSPEPP